MKLTYLQIYFLLLVFFLFNGFQVFSQDNTGIMTSINSSGQDSFSDSGSITYSVGQSFFTYIGESVYNVAQGIQHSDSAEEDNENIDAPEDVIDPEDIDAAEAKIFVYPNPTTDFVTLAMDNVDFDNNDYSYQVFDFQGKLIKQNTLKKYDTKINFNNLSSSIYILQVFETNKIWKTFKILKN